MSREEDLAALKRLYQTTVRKYIEAEPGTPAYREAASNHRKAKKLVIEHLGSWVQERLYFDALGLATEDEQTSIR